MPTELESHSGQNFISEVRFAPRTKALEQRRAQHGYWNAFFNRRVDRPTPFAGVGDTSREAFQLRMLRECDRCQIQQPRSDDTAAPPELSYLRYIEIVLVVFRIAQWRGLSIRGPFLVSFVCMVQHVQSFSVGGHQPVFDSIVNHLHEVTGARRSTVQVTFRGSAGISGSIRCGRRRWNSITSRCQCLEDRIEMGNNILLTSDHLAVTALQSPDTATRADVNVVNACSFQLARAPDVVNVIRISAVDNNVARLNNREKLVDHRIDERRGYHQPNG